MPAHPDIPPPPSRAHWPVRVFRPGEEPGDDLSASTTPEARIALVWELSRRMWQLTGRPWPDTPRRNLPVHIIRPE